MNKREYAISILVGIGIAVLFGAANAYVGLKAGITISASIPAAVISVGVFKYILKSSSLKNTMLATTVGAAGEAVAAGIIFTVPALYIWAREGVLAAPSILYISLAATFGGILGILFIQPMKKLLLVQEKEELIYPESIASSKVILSGVNKQSQSKYILHGVLVSGGFTFLSQILKVFPDSVKHTFSGLKNATAGINILPALIGVGYISGYRVSSCFFTGGIIGWIILIPIITAFGGDNVFFPATLPISGLTAEAIWSSYIKYIGAGAVAAGGIIGLVKIFPGMIRNFGKSIKKIDTGTMKSRLIPITAIAMLGAMAIGYYIFGIVGLMIIIIFGFFFSIVSARMAGMLGSSNNPVSGIAMITLAVSSMVLLMTGKIEQDMFFLAVIMGAVVCVAASLAAETSQVLKTGSLLGGPWKVQELGMVIGVVISSLSISCILMLMDKAWGFGSESLSAPQAVMMKMIVESTANNNLPWTYIFIGVVFAIVMELLNVPVLPVAVGMYLPISMSSCIFLGGLLAKFLDKRKEEFKERGVLFSSGLIVGEGIMGILSAIFAVVSLGGSTVGDRLDLSGHFSLGIPGSITGIIVLVAIFIHSSVREKIVK